MLALEMKQRERVGREGGASLTRGGYVLYTLREVDVESHLYRAVLTIPR